jgi:hypothetical protein
MMRFFHRAPAFSGQMGRLSRNPNWPTNHAQTREIRLQPDPCRQQRHTMHSPSKLVARFAPPSGVRSAFLGFRCPLVL